MKIIVPFFFGGPVDLFKFKEYIGRYYPDLKFLIKFDRIFLEIKLVEANMKKGRVIITSRVSSSGISLIIIEFDREDIEEVKKDVRKFLLTDFEFKIKNEVKKCSLYSFMIEFFLRIFKLSKLEEAADLVSLSRLDKEILNDSGIEFHPVGKDGLFVGFDTPFVIIFTKKRLSGFKKINMEGKDIYLKTDDFFYIKNKSIEEKLIYFIFSISFYKKYANLSSLLIDELKKDITGLKAGIELKKAIEWEWKQREVERKKMNFLEIVSHYKYTDSYYFTEDFPEELMRFTGIYKYRTIIEKNIDFAKFIMENIDKLIVEKQSQILTSHTRRLEYLLTLFGSLGGVATILAVFFSPTLSLPLKILFIIAVILMPGAIVLFEYLFRRRLRRRGRSIYISSMIKSLKQEKQELEKLLKTVETVYELYGNITGKEIISLYRKLLKQKEYEIEELKKELV